MDSSGFLSSIKEHVEEIDFNGDSGKCDVKAQAPAPVLSSQPLGRCCVKVFGDNFETDFDSVADHYRHWVAGWWFR